MLRRTEVLALTLDCRIGPITSEGHIVTTSSPVLPENSIATLSASVLEREYQLWYNKTRQ